MSSGKIVAFEGLRGYMALMVFVSHLVSTAGLPISFDYVGDFAVAVFIILSGFVIALLLSRERAPYRAFLLRRGFRLFPAYLACLILYALLLGVSGDVLQALQDQGWNSPKTASRLVILAKTESHYWEHLLLHTLLLHGLVPDAWLPGTSFAFMGQAWSLTLEWQFYIVAPLLVSMAAKVSSLLGRAAVIFGLVALTKLFQQPSFLLAKLYLFAVGYYSYCLFKDYAAGKVTLRNLRLHLLAFTVVVAPVLSMLPVVIFWGVAMMAALPDKGVRRPLKLLSGFLSTPWAQFLGRVSYTLYCCHMAVIYLVAYLLIKGFGVETHWLYAVTLAVVSLFLSLVLAFLLTKYIEEPSMNYGKSLAQKLAPVVPARLLERPANP